MSGGSGATASFDGPVVTLNSPVDEAKLLGNSIELPASEERLRRKPGIGVDARLVMGVWSTRRSSGGSGGGMP